MKKYDFQVEDWSKIKYLVICNWGVEVGSKYPDPIIAYFYFEKMEDVQDFVSEYYQGESPTRKIRHIFEIRNNLKVEEYEKVTKVRVVAQ